MRLSPQTASVLRALRKDPGAWTYGYDISKSTGIKSGSLYPILARLHNEGWLEAKWTQSAEPGRPPRHVYRLTAVGWREAARVLCSRDQGEASGKLAFES